MSGNLVWFQLVQFSELEPLSGWWRCGWITAVHRFARIASHRILFEFLEDPGDVLVDPLPEPVFLACFHGQPPFEVTTWFMWTALRKKNVLSGTGRSFQTEGDGYAAPGGYVDKQGIDGSQERNTERGENKSAYCQKTKGTCPGMTRYMKGRKGNDRHNSHYGKDNRIFFWQVAHSISWSEVCSRTWNIIIFKFQSRPSHKWPEWQL